MEYEKSRGFSLVELIAVIAVLSLLITVGSSFFLRTREKILDKEFKNVVTYLESKAVEYANKSDMTLVSVGDLIKEGYVDPDDDVNIYDPRNNKSLNCYLIKLEFENGEYVAEFLDKDNTENNGKCADYTPLKNYHICYMDDGVCNSFSDNKWFKDNILLGIKGINEEDINNYNYSWQTNKGQSSTEAYVRTKVNILGEVYYTCNIENEDIKATASKLVKIDKEKPNIISVDMSEELTINKEVIINASDGLGSGVKDYGYALGNGDCVYQSSNKLVVSENGSYKFCVRDNVGNVSEIEKVINTIDTKKPIINALNVNDIYEGDSREVKNYFEIECPPTGCKTITYNYTNTKNLYAGIHALTVTVVGNNNKSVQASTNINVLPKISAKTVGDIVEGTDKKVINYFNVKCSSEECVTKCNYDSTKDLASGSHTLSCEVSWNNKFKASASVKLNVLPKTPSVPKVDVRINNASGASYNGSWTNQNVYFSLSPSVSTDKITKYQVYLGNNLLKVVNATNNKATFTYSNEVESNVYIKACNGDDCSEKTGYYVVKIDKSSPVCSLNVSTSNISFKSKSSDVVSYGVSTSSTPNYTNSSVSISKNTFYGHVLDRAGNTGVCKAYVSGTNKTSDPYTCSYDCGEYESTCEYVCYRYMTSSEKANGKCSGSATEGAYNTCWKWHSSSSCSSTYPYLDSSGTSCSGSTYVPKTCYTTCYSTSYSCSSGYTKLNNSYCYKLG